MRIWNGHENEATRLPLLLLGSTPFILLLLSPEEMQELARSASQPASLHSTTEGPD